MLRPIAINRSDKRSAMEQVMEKGRERLAQKIWVVVFPEGTRVAAGTRKRYRMGGAALAEYTQMPVIPVAHNSGDYWPRNSFIKRPGTVQLVVGPPIESIARSASEINSQAERWIENTVENLRYEAGHGRTR